MYRRFTSICRYCNDLHTPENCPQGRQGFVWWPRKS